MLIGNLGKDPEIRMAGEHKVASFSLATTRKAKQKDGTYEPVTQWHNIIAWRALAELAEKFMKKGSKVYIEGEIQYRSYESDGVTKYITEIDARQIQLLDSKGSTQNTTPAPAPAPQAATPTQGKDDLPF